MVLTDAASTKLKQFVDTEDAELAGSKFNPDGNSIAPGCAILYTFMNF